jgi:hypothetical protein
LSHLAICLQLPTCPIVDMLRFGRHAWLHPD